MSDEARVNFKRLFIHDAENPSDYVVVHWTTSGKNFDGGVVQERFAAGNVRVQSLPGVLKSLEFGLRGVDADTEAALEAKMDSKRLLMLRDSRGVRAYGLISNYAVTRWPNPQLADVDITFAVADYTEVV